MRRTYSLTIAVFILIPILACQLESSPETHGGALNWKGYGEAVSDAKTSGKKVLVDVFTSWCGWCKKMDRDVYSDPKVVEYLQEHFEIVKLDAEAATKHTVDGADLTEKEIAGAYGANSYPTTIFLSDSGEAITLIPGYIQADMFLHVLEFIHGEHYKTTGWNEFLQSKQQQ